MTGPFWISAFLDLAPEAHREASRFWSAVTGYDVSPARGAHEEFTTLVPPDGDDYLRVQRLGEGPSRIHLDLHVAEPQAEAERAVGLGATVLARPSEGYVVLASPGGLVLCLVSHPATRRPPPRDWQSQDRQPGDRQPEDRGDHLSLLDQVCVDIPGEHWDVERAFWSALTGQRPQSSASSDSLAPLERPPGMPLRLLMQRLDEASGPVRAHLDLATTDRDAETARHRGLGATLLRTYPHWTVLQAPGGASYCLTDRDPRTGLLA